MPSRMPSLPAPAQPHGGSLRQVARTSERHSEEGCGGLAQGAIAETRLPIRWQSVRPGCKVSIALGRPERPGAEGAVLGVVHMGVPKIRTVATSLALVGAATLTAAATAAPAQSAASAPPVVVSISNTRVVTMPTTIQPGVNTFKVTTANKRGSAFQLAQAAAGYTRRRRRPRHREGSRRRERQGDQALRGQRHAARRDGGHQGQGRQARRRPRRRGLLGAGHQHQRPRRSSSQFTVAGADTGNVMPEADATLKAVQDTTWANKPESIPNKGLLRFKNAASQNHFIVHGQAQEGQDLQGLQGRGSPPTGSCGSAAGQLRASAWTAAS